MSTGRMEESKSLYELLRRIDENKLMTFTITISYGGCIHLKKEIKFPPNGHVRITFGNDYSYLEIIKELDPEVASLVNSPNSVEITAPIYNGNNSDIRTSLAAAGGGVLLSYNSLTISAHRLCQARVFAGSATVADRFKLERTYANHTHSTKIFSYQEQLNACRSGRYNPATVLSIGCDLVQIHISPVHHVENLLASSTQSPAHVRAFVDRPTMMYERYEGPKRKHYEPSNEIRRAQTSLI